MNMSTMKTHPLIIVAATAVILTCLIASAMMLGIIPRHTVPAQDTVTSRAPAPPAPAVDSRLASRAPADSRLSSRVPPTRSTAPTGAVGSTSPSGAGGTVASTQPAYCGHCGTVTSVHSVQHQGEASVVGPLAGGALGGLLGHQIGHGTGKTVATIAGAAGGAAIGTEVERRAKTTSSYVVNVRLNDGTTRSFNYAAAPGLHEGDRVKVVDGRLVSDS